MKTRSNSTQEGVYTAFAHWMLNHEVSFPVLLEEAISRRFNDWLEEHSTEIIAALVKGKEKGISNGI
jgi:hypothetical protein